MFVNKHFANFLRLRMQNFQGTIFIFLCISVPIQYKFVLHLLKEDRRNRSVSIYQFVIFKPLCYCFEDTIGLNVKASFTRGPVSRLIKPGDITKEF